MGLLVYTRNKQHFEICSKIDHCSLIISNSWYILCHKKVLLSDVLMWFVLFYFFTGNVLWYQPTMVWVKYSIISSYLFVNSQHFSTVLRSVGTILLSQYLVINSLTSCLIELLCTQGNAVLLACIVLLFEPAVDPTSMDVLCVCNDAAYSANSTEH